MQVAGNNQLLRRFSEDNRERVFMSGNFLISMAWSPLEYAEVSVLAREAGEEMLSRLDWMTIKPRIMVDMGCGTGEITMQLRTRYSDAAMLALDLSESMILHANQQFVQAEDAGVTQIGCICADAGKLPLGDASVDLVFA